MNAFIPIVQAIALAPADVLEGLPVYVSMGLIFGADPTRMTETGLLLVLVDGMWMLRDPNDALEDAELLNPDPFFLRVDIIDLLGD